MFGSTPQYQQAQYQQYQAPQPQFMDWNKQLNNLTQQADFVAQQNMLKNDPMFQRFSNSDECFQLMLEVERFNKDWNMRIEQAFIEYKNKLMNGGVSATSNNNANNSEIENLKTENAEIKKMLEQLIQQQQAMLNNNQNNNQINNQNNNKK